MVFFFKYSNVLYRRVAKDPVKFFKFSQILENLKVFQVTIILKGGDKIIYANDNS